MVVTNHDSPSSSPVRITVSSSGGFRNASLTSPIRRSSISNSPLSGGRRVSGSGGGAGRYLSMSKDGNDEYVAYTVHIPPTPDHQFLSNSQTSPVKNHGNPNENRIKDTVFTGGFNSETRAHAKRMKSVEEIGIVKSKSLCQVDGCDEKLKLLSKTECECGFRICNECYIDCCETGPGVCPGCKEKFKEANEYDDDVEDDIQPMMSEEKDTVNPLRRNRYGGGVKLENNFSLVRSFKAPNQEFDHTRWLFETNGTYGFGNAVWPSHRGGGGEYETPPVFDHRRNRPLTRKVGISAAILSPYR